MADLSAIADLLEPKLRKAFLDAVKQVRGLISDEALAAALEVPLGQVDGSLRYIYDRIQGLLTAKRYIAIFREVMEIVANWPKIPVLFSSSFDLKNPRAIEWAARNAAALVTEITNDTMMSLREVIVASQTTGISTKGQAAMIKGMIGLHSQQQQSVARYAQKLIDDQSANNEAHFLHLVSQYQNRLLNYRARNIARTETIRTAYAGQYAIWYSAQDQGFLNPLSTWVEWKVTKDDRLCPYCAPMDGKIVPFGFQFTSTHKGFVDGMPPRVKGKSLQPDPHARSRDQLGQFITEVAFAKAAPLKLLASPTRVLHPPLHPQCRCSLVLRFDGANPNN